MRRDALPAFYRDAREAGIGGGENGLVSDIIACPGLDYCNLANARSLPLADRIFRRFGDPERRAAIGRLQVNISGCINGCGHHHAADIGILGVDKKGVEHYQVTVGGRAGEVAAIGRIIGPSFAEDDVPAVIETIIDTYLAGREADESFAAYITRSGTDALTGAVYQDRTPARRWRSGSKNFRMAAASPSPDMFARRWVSPDRLWRRVTSFPIRLTICGAAASHMSRSTAARPGNGASHWPWRRPPCSASSDRRAPDPRSRIGPPPRQTARTEIRPEDRGHRSGYIFKAYFQAEIQRWCAVPPCRISASSIALATNHPYLVPT